jgi:hypothetical protein
MISRRDVLIGIAAQAMLATAFRRAARAQGPRQGARPGSGASSRPAYMVHVVAGGGLDAVYGMDPKTRKELDADIDLPYEPRAIAEAGNLRLGPHLASLAPWAEKMAIVRGVSVFSVAHAAALAQVMAGKLGLSSHDGQPTMLELFGYQRDREQQPASYIHLGLDPFYWRPGPAHLSGANLFELIMRLSPDELGYVMDALRAQSNGLAHSARGDLRVGATREYLEDTQRLLGRIRELPKPKFEDWSKDWVTNQYAGAFQRALWLMEQDLTSGISIFFYDWDTHLDNHATQTKHSVALFAMLAEFLKRLSTIRNHRGVLADNTLLVLGSELGRFPRLNKFRGKHHFPEAPYLLLGPGIRGGLAFGATGRQMQSLPVDLDTGAPHQGGRQPTLSDLSMTILTAAGVDARSYGYDGRVLGVLAR